MTSKPLICDCCGGRINRATMRCEYCETEYDRKDIPIAGIIEYRRPGEQHLRSTFSIDRRALKEDGAPLMEYCLRNMAGKMAEQLMPFCEFNSMYEPEYDRIMLSARLKVIEPCEPGDITLKRMMMEGGYYG